MRWDNWQKDSPPYKVAWGTNGYISGFRYRRDTTIAWHITTVQAGTIRDYWVTDGRFRPILETHWTFTPSTVFVTDDADATLGTDERTAILAAISGWEDVSSTAKRNSTSDT